MDESKIALIFFGVVIVLVVVIAVPVIVLRRLSPSYKRDLEKARLTAEHAKKADADYASAGLVVDRSLGIAKTKGVLAGFAFTHEVSSPDKSTPPEATVTVPSRLDGDFIVTREVASDSVLERMGLPDKALTGDAAFDRDFLLEGSSREYVQAVFAEARNRDAVRVLFTLGFDRVELDGSRVSAIKSKVELRLMDLPVVTAAVERLAHLQSTARLATVVVKRRISAKQLKTASYAGTFLSISLISWATFGTRPMVEGWWGAAERAWPAIAIASAALVAAMAVALRGSAGMHRELAKIASIIIHLIVGGVCLAVIANQAFDSSARNLRMTRVTNVYVVHGSKSHSCHLDLESWRRDLDHVSLKVPCGIHGRFMRGQTVNVGAHAGLLGFEWMDSIEGFDIA